MRCKRTGTGCLERSAETGLRAQLSLQQYPGRLSKVVWERFLPPLSPHFTTTVSWRRQQVKETWGPPIGFVHQLCTGCCLRGLLQANVCRKGKKEGTVAKWQHCSLPQLQRHAVATKTSTIGRLKKPQNQKKTQQHKNHLTSPFLNTMHWHRQ